MAYQRYYTQAFNWYLKAAKQGYADAENNVGFAYENGQGVPQDYVQAYMWFDLAAAQNVTAAASFRDSLELLMTPEQLAQAQQLATQWAQQHPAGNQ